MILEVLRISSQADSTSGILFDITDNKRKFLCYTIEDEYRAEKVKHETRIPAGIYKLTLRSEGGFHSRYTSKYVAEWHKGMSMDRGRFWDLYILIVNVKHRILK